jgi:hypothetical protein
MSGIALLSPTYVGKWVSGCRDLCRRLLPPHRLAVRAANPNRVVLWVDRWLMVCGDGYIPMSGIALLSPTYVGKRPPGFVIRGCPGAHVVAAYRHFHLIS